MSQQDIKKGRLYCLTTSPITKGRTNELFKVNIQEELILYLENFVRQFVHSFSQQKSSFTFFSHLITLFPKIKSQKFNMYKMASSHHQKLFLSSIAT
jgi:hypothetical protein